MAQVLVTNFRKKLRTGKEIKQKKTLRSWFIPKFPDQKLDNKKQ